MTPAAIRKKLASLPTRPAAFIESMECLAVSKLPDGPQWIYEIKLDGYRAQAVKSDDNLALFSRRRKSFNRQFPHIVEALSGLPDNTVVDGEVLALDEAGRPDFNRLQNFRAEATRIHFFVFDLLVYQNRDLTHLPLIERRELMRSLLKFGSPRIRISEYVQVSAVDMLDAVRQQGLEGIIGKRRDSFYEPGKRSGAWIKYRVNRGQELVIGGFLPGVHGIDSIIVGYYKGAALVYVARVRNGFVPASRRQVLYKLRPLVIPQCPFVNLPETHRSRWGEGLTATDMKQCVWTRPALVAQIEFLERTESDHLRHSKFAGLREDKDPRSVVKEQTTEADNSLLSDLRSSLHIRHKAECRRSSQRVGNADASPDRRASLQKVFANEVADEARGSGKVESPSQ